MKENLHVTDLSFKECFKLSQNVSYNALLAGSYTEKTEIKSSSSQK